MILEVSKQSPVPVYRQIIDQILEAIRLGDLKSGDRLFPIRAVAGELSVNPATVAKAYSELESLGVLTTGGRMGSYISELAEEILSSDNQDNSDDWKRDFDVVLETLSARGISPLEVIRFIKDKHGI